jgi:NAD(P)-dependent dehydrogenase (short-subunit alcohol dehydrogenase family)
MPLNGMVVLIAEGSGALGQIVTPTFVKPGAQVITADRTPSSTQVVGVSAMKADVTNEVDVQHLVKDLNPRGWPH